MDKIIESISEFVNKCLGPLGAGGFTPDTIRDFLIQIIATILLFIIVRIFLWKPITALLEARKEAIDKELVEAKTARENAVMIEEKLNLEYDKSRLKIQELIAQAVKDGNSIKEEIVSDAKKEAEYRFNNATQEIEFEIKKQQTAIKEQIVSIAFLAAEKIVSHEVDKEKYLEVVTDLIESGLGND